MSTRTATNILLAISGLAVILSGFLIWGKVAMAFMKPLHLNASLVMTAACLVHAWTYRASLLRCMGGGRGMALALVTTLLLGLSPFVLDLGMGGKGAGKGGGRHRAELTQPAAEQNGLSEAVQNSASL